jgi:DNA polymerase-3 subunit delta
VTLEALFSQLKSRKFAPVYFFCGEETYYIDQLVQYIEQNTLTPDEREFNQTVLYGLDITVEELISTAKRYPMMSEYQVVIVKEAQLLKQIDLLDHYLNNPQKSTILVIAYKGKEPDKRKSFGKNLEKTTVYFKSERLKEERMPEWISSYISKKGYRITARAAIMIAEFVGNELEKVANEVDKLFLNYPVGFEFTEKEVESNVGISKEYNVFEFQKALGQKNVLKANQIAFYFGSNSKNHPIQMIIGFLFQYFNKLLHYHWLKSQGERELPKALGVPYFFIKDYETAAKHYSPAKLIKIIHHLRDYDLRSKGINNTAADGELLKELTFKIVH